MYSSVVGPWRRRLAPWLFGALSTALFFAAAGQGWLYLVYGRGLPAGLDVAKWVPIAWRALAAGWLAALATFVLVDRSRVPWRVPVASAFSLLLGLGLHLTLRATLWRHLDGGCYRHGYTDHPYLPPGVDTSNVVFVYDEVCYDLLPDAASSLGYALPYLIWTTALAAVIGALGAWMRVRASARRAPT
jgi:hypothetical protein